MNCKNCGAPLTVMFCNYCKTTNSVVRSGDSNLTGDTEEILELEERIARLKNMSMPEAMKTKKIEILQKKIIHLNN